MRKKIKNAKVINCHFFVSLMLVVVINFLFLSKAHSQNDVIDSLVPIVSFLLSEESQCPSIDSGITVSGQSITGQSDIDNLVGVTRIDGNLDLININVVDDVLDFSPLDSLVEITGDLNFNETNLVNISGFNCLNTVGQNFAFGPTNGFLINNGNFNLNSISGFQMLESVGGDFNIALNLSLTIIPEFESLQSIGGRFTIDQNLSLNRIPEFTSLQNIGTDFTIAENDITSASGFPLLESVGQNFFIFGNQRVTSISQFPSLESISGEFFIFNNSSLTSVSGFPELEQINGSFVFQNNSDNVELDGFMSLSDVGGDINLDDGVSVDCSGQNATSILCQNITEPPLECPVVTSETTFSGFGGVEINNQSDVDQFIGITRIEAVLNFGFGPEDTNIDFSPFDSLVEATGNFNMRISGPIDLVGFNCLRMVGGNFNIDSPDAVERISGFNSLESIGNQFAINNSPNLISVDGFESLETIGTFLQISGNSSLTSISGFESLISTNQFFQIGNNANLNSISGFNSFVSGGTFVQFDSNIVECNAENQESLLCQ